MPDHIPGLYNYCDRWCERCPLTARCQVFSLEQVLRRRSDDENASFWAAFEEGLEIDSEIDDLELVDSDDPDDGDAIPVFQLDDDSDGAFGRAGRDPLSRAAMDFALDLRRWMIEQGFENRSPDVVNPATAARDDALDVLGWYSFQIGVKLTRAMSGQIALDDEALDAPAGDDDAGPIEADDDLDDSSSFFTETSGDAVDADDLDDDLEGEGWDDEEDDGDVAAVLRDAERTDRDGSAKVALIGIERSLGALTVLRRELPALDASLRGFFRRLSQLRVEIDRRWPNARTFHRPGFDD